MQKNILNSFLLLVLAVTFFSAAAEQVETTAEPSKKVIEPAKDANSETTRKKYEPASKFVPSEKLRADDAISFPVDI